MAKKGLTLCRGMRAAVGAMEVRRVLCGLADCSDDACPEAQAVADTADHLRKYCEPRMRQAIFNHLDGGGDGLTPYVLKAVERLRAETADAIPPPATARGGRSA